VKGTTKIGYYSMPELQLREEYYIPCEWNGIKKA
jgi:hypothetical protein